MDNQLGEIIYTSTTEMIGQCINDKPSPPYACMIRAGHDPVCIGVVYHVETTSIDPHRRPSALGIPEDQIHMMYPQLAGLLRSEFHAYFIGTMREDHFRFGLPATPPHLHIGVRECSENEIITISENLGFLRLLYSSGKTSVEELLIGVSEYLLKAHRWERTFAVRLGKALSEIFRDDYDTLRRIVSRLEAYLVK
jgi:hypothetical protein